MFAEWEVVIIKRAEDRAATSSFLIGSLHLRAPKIWIRGTTDTVNSNLAVEGLGGRCQTQVLCTKTTES